MEKLKAITKNILLAFALISIGFALGRETTARQQQAPPPRQAPPLGPEIIAQPPAAEDSKIVVYYLHATFRCTTCNEIERLARTLVETEFADDLKAGKIEWREANFQKDKALATQYEIVSSCVVIAHIQDGKETGFQRLDEVWTHYENPTAFNEYVGAAIRKYQKGGTP